MLTANDMTAWRAFGRPCWYSLNAFKSNCRGPTISATLQSHGQAVASLASRLPDSQRKQIGRRPTWRRSSLSESLDELDYTERLPSLEHRQPSLDETEGVTVVAEQAQVTQETEERAELVAVFIGLAFAMGGAIWALLGPEKAFEYFAGYLLEQSLSVDNLFVFVLVFDYFQTDSEGQEKILKYGLASAAILRLIMILLGAELIDNFQPVLLGRFLKVSDSYDGNNFFTERDGVRMATPLLLALAVVEISDVVFAVDSIPAVFGITHDPLIVWVSNMMAIASLRALYGFVSRIMKTLRFLDKAVALVLAWIGLKMIADFGGVHVDTRVSLGVVASLLGAGVGASYLLPAPPKEQQK
ncbi:hypothetical protein WJX73_004953 [Symbiochloris irregularis]|uniref:Integral membrane protein TerC n=1 Tax=Symbiochloris irregularis TaxID=706552 RepID=A0AAW1NPY0_9CHLO